MIVKQKDEKLYQSPLIPLFLPGRETITDFRLFRSFPNCKQSILKFLLHTTINYFVGFNDGITTRAGYGGKRSINKVELKDFLYAYKKYPRKRQHFSYKKRTN